MSNSVQLDNGNTRIVWPFTKLVFALRQNSGRWLRGSHRCPVSRRLKMRSFARLRSSSRRPPPMAASYCPRSSSSSKGTVRMIRVYSWMP